ncbi:MAG: cupin domain-containing protein [Bacteroidetes bacterium]|nr:cupin domain-containing protein [Bacteroidota bacterium]
MENKIITNNLEWHEGKVKNFFGKELLNLNNGTVKLVKIASGAEYPMHIHPDKTEYIYVVKGEITCKIAEDTHIGGVGDFFIFPHNIFHALSNHTQNNCEVLVGAIKI